MHCTCTHSTQQNGDRGGNSLLLEEPSHDEVTAEVSSPRSKWLELAGLCWLPTPWLEGFDAPLASCCHAICSWSWYTISPLRYPDVQGLILTVKVDSVYSDPPLLRDRASMLWLITRPIFVKVCQSHSRHHFKENETWNIPMQNSKETQTPGLQVYGGWITFLNCILATLARKNGKVNTEE